MRGANFPDSRYWSPITFNGQYRVVGCGQCCASFDVREWARHWVKEHGTRDELEIELTAIQRGDVVRAASGSVRDKKAQFRRWYRLNARNRSARVQRWYKAHPEVRRRMEKTKITQLPGASWARRLKRWWSANWPVCSRCGARITLSTLAGRAVSFCPEHGLGWDWSGEQLFWTTGEYHARGVETKRRSGSLQETALKVWATRRARGHVGEDCRRAWRARRERYGPSGIRVTRTGGIPTGAYIGQHFAEATA
jgi:hypothetical protein